MKNGCSWYRQFTTEEHITVITEPNNNFLTHITSVFSTAKGNTLITTESRPFSRNLRIFCHFGPLRQLKTL